MKIVKRQSRSAVYPALFPEKLTTVNILVMVIGKINNFERVGYLTNFCGGPVMVYTVWLNE